MANLTRELVRATTSPIVYHPGGWEESLPDHLSDQVVPERLKMVLAGEWDRASDLEVMCYMFTATLAGPVDHDWLQIYAYVTALWIPDKEAPDKLDPGQQRELDLFKRQMWEIQQSRKETAMPENVLVVIAPHDKGVRVTLGAEGCDPIIVPLEGTLEEALGGQELKVLVPRPEGQDASVQQLVASAQARWADAPRNPKYSKPKASRGKAKADDDAAQPPADAGAGQADPDERHPSAEPPADAATTEAVPAAPDNTGAAEAAALPLLSGDDGNGRPEAQRAAEEHDATAGAAKVTEAITSTGVSAELVAGASEPLSCGLCPFAAYSQEALDEHTVHAHGGSPEAPEATETPAEPAQAPEPVEGSAGASEPEPVGAGKFVIRASGLTFDTVHAALLELGETQQEIDKHQYWHRVDRLPKRLAEQLRKRD